MDVYSAKPSLMSVRLIGNITYLVGAIVWLLGTEEGLAQSTLPVYDIWRVQNAPRLSYGAYPVQILTTDSSIFVLGAGWDSLSSARGSYADEVVGERLNEIFIDTTSVYNYSQWHRHTVVSPSTGNLVLGLRTQSFDTYIDSARLGRVATYAEALYRPAPGAQLQHHIVDSVSVFPPPPRHVLLKGLRVFDLQPSNSKDTVRFMYIYSNTALDTGWIKVQNLIPDPQAGARSTGAGIDLQLEGHTYLGTEGYKAIFGAWCHGDTLSTVWRSGSPTELIGFTVRRFSLRTGARLADAPAPYRIGGESVPNITLDPVHGRVFDAGMTVEPVPPNSSPLRPQVTAFDPYLGQRIGQRTLHAPEGWGNDGFYTAQPDPDGDKYICAFSAARRTGTGGTDWEWRTEVVGLNAATGDSLWSTTLYLDSFALPNYQLAPMDIAPRPDGRGYVVAGWVGSHVLDPHRDLRYSYTALFFLDSVGCLVPDCRKPSAVGEPKPVRYEIRLAPNPVPPNVPLGVELGAEVSGGVDFTITDASGHVFDQGEQHLSAPGAKLLIKLPPLPAGTYFLTVRWRVAPVAVVTKGFVIGSGTR